MELILWKLELIQGKKKYVRFSEILAFSVALRSVNLFRLP